MPFYSVREAFITRRPLLRWHFWPWKLLPLSTSLLTHYTFQLREYGTEIPIAGIASIRTSSGLNTYEVSYDVCYPSIWWYRTTTARLAKVNVESIALRFPPCCLNFLFYCFAYRSYRMRYDSCCWNRGWIKKTLHLFIFKEISNLKSVMEAKESALKEKEWQLNRVGC